MPGSHLTGPLTLIDRTLADVTQSPGIYTGSGAPTITAPKGSIYLNEAGSGIANRIYVNTDGAGTWTSVTTAA